MISLTLGKAATLLQGTLHGQDLTIDAVTTDTRKVTAGCLFVALKGERFDAHDFAEHFSFVSLTPTFEQNCKQRENVAELDRRDHPADVLNP